MLKRLSWPVHIVEGLVDAITLTVQGCGITATNDCTGFKQNIPPSTCQLQRCATYFAALLLTLPWLFHDCTPVTSTIRLPGFVTLLWYVLTLFCKTLGLMVSLVWLVSDADKGWTVT